MSSFKRIDQNINKIERFAQSIDDSDVVLLKDQEDVIKLKGRLYRKADTSSQELLYHYLFDQKECRKVYLHSKGWFVAIQKHKCHINCKDSGGLKCKGDCGYAIHDNLFFEDDKGMYHLEPPSIRDRQIVSLAGLKFVKRYYRH